MRRLSLACAALALATCALAAISPAKADPYHLIRWDNTGYCQIWDLGMPLQPVRWPADYKVISKPIPTLTGALAAKSGLVQHGTCKF